MGGLKENTDGVRREDELGATIMGRDNHSQGFTLVVGTEDPEYVCGLGGEGVGGGLKRLILCPTREIL